MYNFHDLEQKTKVCGRYVYVDDKKSIRISRSTLTHSIHSCLSPIPGTGCVQSCTTIYTTIHIMHTCILAHTLPHFSMNY